MPLYAENPALFMRRIGAWGKRVGENPVTKARKTLIGAGAGG
jgi:hypothetical protein